MAVLRSQGSCALYRPVGTVAQISNSVLSGVANEYRWGCQYIFMLRGRVSESRTIWRPYTRGS